MSDDNRPQPRPGILDINIYKAGAAKVDGIARPAKLSANETPLGPSPKAIAAFEKTAASLERYPDSAATDLRAAIGKAHDIDPDRIVVGAGSDELLQLLGQAYIGEGDDVIYTEHSFVVYRLVTAANGANGIEVPEINYRADVDAILEAVTEKTRVVYLANPNNPTGTYLSADEVARLHEGLRADILLVLDEAYSEYVHDNDFATVLPRVHGAENLVMTRTFSKIYGLAAARLGWAYCPAHIAGVLNRIRGPFNTTVGAQAAGIEALRDKEHLAKAVAHNDQWLAWLAQQIGGLGIDFTPSVGNFILMHFADAKTATRANAHLLSRGIIVRPAPAPKLGHSLRLSIGLEAENRQVVEALGEFMKSE